MLVASEGTVSKDIFREMMARKRKSRCKDKTPINKEPDSGQTSKRRFRGKEAVGRKRKAVSDMSRHRSKPYKKVKSSSSVELVRVLPCCSSEKERKKYAKLGLDSALFLSSSKPAKRRQSHISVITISSSDDEDLSNDKTSDWISKIDMGTINTTDTEEPFSSGDATYLQNDSMIEEILDAEKFRPQRSYTELCSTPESTFNPLCASTPEEKISIFQPVCLKMLETDKDNLLIYKGPSFLENPVNNLRQHITDLHVSESQYTMASTKQNQRDNECQVNSVSTSCSRSPKFYFGPSQYILISEQTCENNETRGAPMRRDWSYFRSGWTEIEGNANTTEKESQKQVTEARRYSLAQIPSTSNAPVSDPVLEVVPKKKKSKIRNKSPS